MSNINLIAPYYLGKTVKIEKNEGSGPWEEGKFYDLDCRLLEMVIGNIVVIDLQLRELNTITEDEKFEFRQIQTSLNKESINSKKNKFLADIPHFKAYIYLINKGFKVI